MRIAFVLTSLGVGGAERQVLGLARRMAARGHAVCILVLLPPGQNDLALDSASPALEIIHLGINKRPSGVISAMIRGAKELSNFRPGIIHSHNFHGNMAARLLGLFVRTPVISTIHNVYEGGWQRMLAYRLTDTLSCRTIAVSEVARERYVRLRAIAARKSGAIPNGIETDAFTPDSVRRTQTRAAMAAAEDFVWIATGRLAEAKDYPNLLRAFAQIRSASSATQLWIAGAGAPQYAESLHDLSRSLGLADSVQWLGLRDDLPALLDAADGFVLSSAWEGMPLALGEAMAMEKQVAATDVGGVRELTGESSHLVPAADSTALSRAMLEIMRLDSQERAAIGAAARARILTHFSMDAAAEVWERLYRSVIQI